MLAFDVQMGYWRCGLWDLTSGKQLRRLEGPERLFISEGFERNRVSFVTFSPSSKYWMACMHDSTKPESVPSVRLCWELATGQELQPVRGH